MLLWEKDEITNKQIAFETFFYYYHEGKSYQKRIKKTQHLKTLTDTPPAPVKEGALPEGAESEQLHLLRCHPLTSSSATFLHLDRPSLEGMWHTPVPKSAETGAVFTEWRRASPSRGHNALLLLFFLLFIF